MYAIIFVTAFLLSLFLPSVYVHSNGFADPISLEFAGLSMFLCINVFICVLEWSLFFHFGSIRKDYLALKKKLPKGDLGKIPLFEDISVSTAFSLKFWGRIWSTYALVDKSYATDDSFGWFVDIGNGFTTVIPTLLFLYVISTGEDINSLLTVQNIGLIGFVSFWQEMYGTFLYFAQYIRFKRWENHNNTATQVLLLVIFSNPLWIIFPAQGMFVAYHMITTNQAYFK